MENANIITEYCYYTWYIIHTHTMVSKYILVKKIWEDVYPIHLGD